MNTFSQGSKMLNRSDWRAQIVNVAAIGAILGCFFYVGNADYEDALRAEQVAANSACRHAVMASYNTAGHVRAVRVETGVSTIFICNVARVAS